MSGRGYVGAGPPASRFRFPPSGADQRGPHNSGGVCLGGLLVAVGRIGDLERAVAGARDGALALLDDVSELVREGVLVRTAVADNNVAAGGVGAGADLGGGGAGGAAGVEADVGEVRAEAALHLVPERRRQRLAGATQHVLDRARGYLRRPGRPGRRASRGAARPQLAHLLRPGRRGPGQAGRLPQVRNLRPDAATRPPPGRVALLRTGGSCARGMAAA